MTTLSLYVALLRGINVGGHRKLPMKELSALCQELGCQDVRTYIQSGNLIFRGSAELAAAFPTVLSTAIAERYDYEVPVVVRSDSELQEILTRSPYADIGADPRFVHVAFLSAEPSPDAVAALDPNRSPPDRFAFSKTEVFLYFPEGSRKSKLSNGYFEKVLGVRSTMRNWRTVTKLAQMIGT